MSSPYEYTPRRRLLAQVAMVGLLGVMLGAAQLMALHRQRQDVHELDYLNHPIMRILPYPRGWKVEPEADSITAVDRSRVVNGVRGRLMRVSLTPRSVAPVLDEELTLFARGGALTDRRSITLAERRGLAAIVRRPEANQETAVAVTQFSVEGLSLLIQVEVQIEGGKLTPQDIGLLNDICDEMRVGG